jgi:hypothetical protein
MAVFVDPGFEINGRCKHGKSPYDSEPLGFVKSVASYRCYTFHFNRDRARKSIYLDGGSARLMLSKVFSVDPIERLEISPDVCQKNGNIRKVFPP